MLFALYVAAMGEELASSTLGVTLYRICISALFFAVSKIYSYKYKPPWRYLCKCSVFSGVQGLSTVLYIVCCVYYL